MKKLTLTVSCITPLHYSYCVDYILVLGSELLLSSIIFDYLLSIFKSSLKMFTFNLEDP